MRIKMQDKNVKKIERNVDKLIKKLILNYQDIITSAL